MTTTISDAGAHGTAEATDRVPASKAGAKGYLTLSQVLAYIAANIEVEGGDMSASEILAALVTVDGASSGLDADLLDGNHASAFALSGHNHTGTYQPLDSDLTSIAGLTTTAGGRGLLTLADPGADRILFWDDGAGAYAHLTVGTGLAIDGTTLEATGGGGGGIGSLVEDTSPQLGGDLDLNGNDITGMVIGTDIQAYSANLTEFAGVNPSANGLSLVSAADYAAMRGLLDLEAGTDFLSPAAIAAAYQPLDSDLTAIAALTTTAAGRSVLTIADPGADRIVAWDDTAGAMAAIALADITTEAAPAAGDYLLLYTAEGALVKVDWDDLPAGGGSGVAEGDSPTWTGAHTFARGTITDSSPSISITQTWNDAADTFTAFLMNITQTASQGASKLFDFQVGGTSIFNLQRSGNLDLTHASSGAKYSIVHGFGPSSGAHLTFNRNDAGVFAYSNAGLFALGNRGIGFANGANDNPDALFYRGGAADIIAMRRSTNAQKLRVNNTFTDESNQEYVEIGWGSNICTIQTAEAGTGTLRNLVFNGANRATYSETPEDIAAALVAWGIMAPSE